MIHAISLSSILLCTWLLLSGIFTPLLIFFGFVSVGVVVGIALRMEVIDHESHPIHLTWTIPAYWLWLLTQIIKSNIDVAKTILGVGDPVEPNILHVKPTQSTEIGQVIYANSITLTPGTISIEFEDGEIMVHALTRRSAADLTQGAMNQRVTMLERKS